jgi:hypothetical protein
LRLHRSAVVGRIVLQPENHHPVILDFCNTICQKRTHAAQQKGLLFDHFVGACEERERHLQAKGLCRLGPRTNILEIPS